MPVLLLVIASALWGLSFPLLKALHLEQASRLPDVSSLFLSAWIQSARFGLSALLILPFVIRRGRPSLAEVRQGLALTFWGGLGMWLQTDALAYTDASTSAFLTGAYCVFIPLWTSLRRRLRPGLRVLVATLMVFTGGTILSGLRPEHLQLGRGEIETLCAALLFSFQILTFENPRYEKNRGLFVSFIMFLGISILFIPITLVAGPNSWIGIDPGASMAAMVLIGCLTLFCSVGAFMLMTTCQSRVSATEAGLIYTSEPAFTAIYVLFLPAILGDFVKEPYANERFSISMAIGGSLILAANGLMQWKRTPKGSPLPVAGRAL